MLQKFFSSIFTVIFIVLVLMFAYKTMYKPQLVVKSVHQESDESKGKFVLREELNSLIKEYIINNPSDIIASLESIQNKQISELEKKASDYISKHRKEIEEADNPPVIGNSDADIFITMFYDYSCSFCKKANQHIKEILSLDNQVKVILRPIPILSDDSVYASKVALAVHKIAQSQFLSFHNDLMDIKLLDKASVRELVRKYNLDFNLVENEINSYSMKQSINKNFEFAKGLGIRGAPSYVINGNFMPGLITTEKFKSIIEQIRKSQ